MSKIEQKKRFLDNGIPYDALDEEMRDLIDVLNFNVGIKTKYCCYGHDEHHESYIVFDDKVDDNQIYNLLDFLIENDYGHFGSYKKWVRSIKKGSPLLINWIWDSEMRIHPDNFEYKKAIIDRYTEILKTWH